MRAAAVAAGERRPPIRAKASADAGDRLARWFEQEYPALVRYAIGISGERHLAEDLVQEAFIRTSLSRVDLGNPGPYVRRTILNLSRSRFRHRSVEQRALARHGLEDPIAASPERDDEMWRALARLSPRQRAVLTLRFYEDWSEADIAKTLGISPGNVKKHASRGLDRLRAALNELRSE